MKLSALRKATRGRRLAWLALLALLFQQFGMVAYACTLTQVPPEPAPMMADCDGMRIPPPPEQLCDEHCNPDTATSIDMRAGHVPPLALPPPVFALRDAPATFALAPVEVRLCSSDPPPTLRFCSLLI